jgi:KipI family sensor histidine kinase inhibitor
MSNMSDGAHRVRLFPAGDSALLVELGDAIDEALNRRVHALDAALSAAKLAGVREMVPTYRSILVHFDPLISNRAALGAQITALAATCDSVRLAARSWKVPVAYGGEHGVDLGDVAAAAGLSTEAVIGLHSGAEYVVYMIGYSPGFAYLGGLPDALHLPRRPSPRLMTPAGSIMQGGMQAAISPLAMPSGWHLLGRTPALAYDPRRAEPFLFRPGDRIRFEPIAADAFARLSLAAEHDGWLPACEAGA